MVYLVGAGIGGAELITVKGLECIKQADVIVYDHLVNPTLLSYAKEDCELIYAGKTAGSHHMVQEEINKTLVRHGRNKTVVRLKGGDPLVFGRGGEEADTLNNHNIEYEFVPGISSSYAAAEYCGIPVTHRGTASTFHVITGHEKGGGKNVDYTLLAKLRGTLVFLMGLGSAEAIAENLIRAGKDPETKTAVISRAASEKQKCIKGALKTLPLMAEQMRAPAIIVVGDVVGFGREWFKPSGAAILSTGTKNINAQIKNAFGNVPVTEIPLIKITAVNYDAFTKVNLADYSHIAFTSANGVSIFFDYMKRAKKDIRLLSNIKFAVVGQKTADALMEIGIFADIVPAAHSGAALAETLGKENIKKILLIRAENGLHSLPEGLKNADIKFDDLHIYRTDTDLSKKELLNLCAKDMDYIIFSSGSAARAFKEMLESETNAKLISIGNETTKTAEEYGIKIYKTAKKASAEGIAECIIKDMRKKQ